MTGDPARDDHATGHPFGVPDGSDMEPNEYADHQRRAERAKACEQRMSGYFNGVDTVCGRPAGHDGDCHPVPLAQDKEDT